MLSRILDNVEQFDGMLKEMRVDFLYLNDRVNSHAYSIKQLEDQLILPFEKLEPKVFENGEAECATSVKADYEKSFMLILYGYPRHNPISVVPECYLKTTLTCPYGTFALNRMCCGLYNFPTMFQCCMLSIFGGIVEDSMEIFMDDFSSRSNSF